MADTNMVRMEFLVKKSQRAKVLAAVKDRKKRDPHASYGTVLRELIEKCL